MQNKTTNPNPPVYWTMANGEKINVDDMGCQHLRNTLKMVLRKIEAYNQKMAIRNKEARQMKRFGLEGDMAQFFNDECEASAQNEDQETYTDFLMRKDRD